MRKLQEHKLRNEFESDRRRHGKGGDLGFSPARQAGGERLHAGEKDGGERQGAHERGERFPFRARHGRKQKGSDARREGQQKRRRGQGEKESAFEGKERALLRFPQKPFGLTGGHGGNDGRGDAVAHGNGQIDQRCRRPRVQPVQSGGVGGVSSDEPHDENAVQKVGKGQKSRSNGDGDRHPEQLFCTQILHTFAKKRTFGALSPCQKSKEKASGKLAERDGRQRPGDRFERFAAESAGKEQAERHLDRLFADLRKGGGKEVALALEPAAQAGEHGHEKHPGRQGAVGGDGAYFPLRRAHGGCKQKHQRAAAQPHPRKQEQGFEEHRAALGMVSPALRGRDDARQPRRDARCRYGEQKTIERVHHLVYPHSLAAENICERDPVKRAQYFCRDPADGNDDRALQEILFHM